jgi:adenylate kinase family enzyme
LKYPYDYFLIDGFPRNVDNWEGWQRHMPSIASIELILYIHCTQEKLSERILQRGLTSNRNDDNLVTLNKRFATFRNDSWPIIQYFQAHSQHNATEEGSKRAIGFYTLPPTQPGQQVHISSYQPPIPTPSLRLPYEEISGDGTIQDTYDNVKGIVLQRLRESVKQWNEDISSLILTTSNTQTTDTIRSHFIQRYPALTSTEIQFLTEEWEVSNFCYIYMIVLEFMGILLLCVENSYAGTTSWTIAYRS